MTPADLAAALVVVVLWGLNFVAGKIALAALPPFLVMTLRFAGVALVLAPWTWPGRARLPALALLALVLGIGHFGLLFVGLSGLEAGSTAVVIQLGVPFSVLLAWAVFGDRPDRRTVLGIALAFAGVALLAGEGGRAELGSLLIVMVAMVMWAVSNILVKRLGAISPFSLNGWVSLLAMPMAASLSLACEHSQKAALAAADGRVWGALAFTIVGSSVVAYTLWYHLLARYPVSRVVPFTLLGPAIGFAAGVVVLGESAGAAKVIGGLLTVAGVAVIELRFFRRGGR